MWIYFLILVLPCMILAVIAKAVWHKDITTKEMLAVFGSSIAGYPKKYLDTICKVVLDKQTNATFESGEATVIKIK